MARRSASRSGDTGETVVRRSELTSYDRKRPVRILLALGVLGPLAAALAGAYLPGGIGDQVESDLASKSRNALDEAGFQNVSVRIAGRDATLSGADSMAEGHLSWAKRIVQEVGVRTVSIEKPGTNGGGDAISGLPELRPPKSDAALPTATSLPTASPSSPTSTPPSPTATPRESPSDGTLQSELDGILASTPIEFVDHSHRVTYPSLDVVERIAGLLNENPGSKVQVIVEGGDSSLTSSRAREVSELLYDFGADSSRLSSQGSEHAGDARLRMVVGG